MTNSSTNPLAMPTISLLSKWLNLGYTYDYQSLPPNYPTLFKPVLLPKEISCPVIPIYPQKTYIQVLYFILNSSSSTRYPAKKLPHSSPLLMLPPATSLDIPPYQNIHHSKSSRPPFSSPTTIATKYPYVGLMKV